MLAAILWLLLAPAALAVNPDSLPQSAPPAPVLDTAQVLSRSTSGEIARQLEGLQSLGVDAHLLTVPRLDYGQGLGALGDELIRRWQRDDSPGQLLLLIDAKTTATAIVASPSLQERLPQELLLSTARTTFAQPLREGSRYRQASLDAISRLGSVLQGEPDPGEPVQPVSAEPIPTNVPSQADTEASRAWVWITVLLVVGTLVPMLTWWVFSR